MKFRLRLSSQTLRLLDIFLQRPTDWRYGYDLSRDTALKSGTLYPLLMRLAEPGILETRWEMSQEGKPPRHMYRLTKMGLEFAREKVTHGAVPKLARRPAFGGGEA